MQFTTTLCSVAVLTPLHAYTSIVLSIVHARPFVAFLPYIAFSFFLLWLQKHQSTCCVLPTNCCLHLISCTRSLPRPANPSFNPSGHSTLMTKTWLSGSCSGARFSLASSHCECYPPRSILSHYGDLENTLCYHVICNTSSAILFF